jgi:serine/threonine-protein kinase
MGAVYKAWDSELDRTIALKLIRPELAASPQTLARFKQELLLASRISHKNVLRIHDLGDLNGVKFITMAYVEGSDLAAVLAGGRLPFDRAMKYARQLCAALDAAHGEGVVHRDLKPQNVLIDRADNACISDFGLAKTLEPDLTMMTRTGQILGTPRYMSPEQVEAKEVDHRSDLYSLGIIMYEMFTGAGPFTGESAMQLMFQRVSEAPRDPVAACPDLPENVAKVILKCLERDPAARYRSASGILHDLDTGHAPAVSAPAGSDTISIQIPKPPRRLWMSAVAILLVAAALLAVPAVRRRLFGVQEIQQRIAVLPLANLGGDSLKYLADGLGDSLSARLSGLRNVYVPSGGSVRSEMRLKDPQKIAGALGVNVLVQGTVEASGDQIAVTVSVRDFSKKDGELLHKQFPGVRQDLLTLEDQVFDAVVDALLIRRSNNEMAATMNPTVDYGAYDAYLQGREIVNAGSRDMDKALAFFDQAIQRDSRFALAYAGIADACMRMWDRTKDNALLQRAYAAAQQAQRLNKDLPEARFALGTINTNMGNTAGAIAELQAALRLVPKSDEARRRLGLAYLAAGKQQEAIENFTAAKDLNPYFWNNSNMLGVAYFQFGENEKALAAFGEVIRLAPDLPTGYAQTGAVLLRQGKWGESARLFEKAIQLRPAAPYYSNLGTTYFFLGRYADAAKMYQKAVELQPNDALYLGNLADAWRWSGEKQKAAETYDKAIAQAFQSYRVNPQSAKTLGQLAIFYAKQGDPGRASDYIQKARSIDPKANALMYKEATIHALAGRTADALASLEQALRSGYSLEEAKSDPELKVIRETPEFKKLESQLNTVDSTRKR